MKHSHRHYMNTSLPGEPFPRESREVCLLISSLVVELSQPKSLVAFDKSNEERVNVIMINKKQNKVVQRDKWQQLDRRYLLTKPLLRSKLNYIKDQKSTLADLFSLVLISPVLGPGFNLFGRGHS